MKFFRTIRRMLCLTAALLVLPFAGSAEETFAVEDSPNGVTSAYLAGCNVVMVPDLTQPDEELSKKL